MITRIIPTCWFSFIGLLVLIDKILQSGFMVGLPLELISKMRRTEKSMYLFPLVIPHSSMTGLMMFMVD